jgi:hypothetical protein
MRAMGGAEKPPSRRCSKSHRICQIRPSTKPIAIATEIWKTITSSKVIGMSFPGNGLGCPSKGYRTVFNVAALLNVLKWSDDKARPIPRGLKRPEATLGHGHSSPTEPALGGTEADNSGESVSDRTRIPSQNSPRSAAPIFREHLGGRSLTRLSISLGHTIGAAAKYSQFCPFEGGQ